MILLRWSFPPLGNSDHVSVSVSIDFPSNSQQNCIAYTILMLIGMVFVIFWEMFHWRISLSLVLLMLLVNFVNGFRLELSLIEKYQVKPHSSSWFSAACAAAIFHRNHFFPLYQKDKFSDSEVKFRQATKVKFSHHYKRVPEAARLAYANKTKESMISQKLGSCDF